MKKSIAIVFLALTLLLCSCAPAVVKEPADCNYTAYEAVFNIAAGNSEEHKIKITRETSGEASLEFVEPFLMRGITAKYLDGKLSLFLLGVPMTVEELEEDYRKTADEFVVILDVMAGLYKDKEVVKNSGKVTAISVDIEGTKYTVNINNETKLPVSAQVSGSFTLSIKIEDFTWR